jgi:FlaA1/EpsC-like NDP-sugar epimerase
MKMPISDVEKVLGRPVYHNLCDFFPQSALNKRVLITGANGSIGTDLIRRLKELGMDYLATDIEGKHEYMDVTDFQQVLGVVNKYQPDFIINIAGAKHAPEGEHETWKTLSINTIGTKNLIDACGPRTKLILTSTCKSCNPEIVYGASKLIAERMTLNAGGSVARFFNVVETSGNVFEIWDKMNVDEPIHVAKECGRHFISVKEATGLIVFLMETSTRSGKYIVNSPQLRKMDVVAEALYPEREKVFINRRRGDRLYERFKGTAEEEMLFLNNAVIKLTSNHEKDYQEHGAF